MTATVADALLDQLAAHGVRVCFGIPGVHNLPLWNGAGQQGRPRVVGVRHEQAAGYAADALARATGGVGVALTTTGPGFVNALAAFGEAWTSFSPVLLLSSETPVRPRRTSGLDDGLLHGMGSQAGMVEVGFGARAVSATTGEEALAALPELVAHALATGRPVYLGVPADVLHHPAPDQVPGPIAPSPARPDADAVRLADGRRVACGLVINAAGTGAVALARTAGIHLPVHSRKRCVFQFRSPAALGPCPLVIDPTGLYFRPEGDGYLCGIAPPEAEDPECHDFEVPLHWWEERLWPALAQRVPGFEAARLLSAWAGHYDVNHLDANVILGPHPDRPGLLFANGFSGHGLQQSPAIGRALSELALHGGFRTLDLSRLGWARVLANQPLRERNVV